MAFYFNKLLQIMNPSASGWIEKLLEEVSENNACLDISLNMFYNELKSCGFIYGNNVSIINNCIDKSDLTTGELCKANLLLAFYFIHNLHHQNTNFINSVIEFYNTIEHNKTSFFGNILKKKSSKSLERIIDKRILLGDNFITKNFNYFVTNALLFVDIIAYHKFIVSNKITKKELQSLEFAIETVVISAFEAKENRTKYDESLIKLFEVSLRYNSNVKLSYANVTSYFKDSLEKKYIIDIVCMALWTDEIISQDEHEFLLQLGIDIDIDSEIIEQSINHINTFYATYKDQITLLNSKNLVENFYDNSSKMVHKLITRNSKRLLKELNESKELMRLLSQSTTRNLTDEEQKKAQKQLLDIFKTIPSLAIFILPGGMLLYPLVIKFIPKLLPSAFDDNRIEK